MRDRDDHVPVARAIEEDGLEARALVRGELAEGRFEQDEVLEPRVADELELAREELATGAALLADREVVLGADPHPPLVHLREDVRDREDARPAERGQEDAERAGARQREGGEVGERGDGRLDVVMSRREAQDEKRRPGEGGGEEGERGRLEGALRAEGAVEAPRAEEDARRERA